MSDQLRRRVADLLRVHGWPAVLEALVGGAGEKSRREAAAGRESEAWQWVQLADYLRRVRGTYLPPEEGGGP
jgi:hypothetical protein